MGATICSDTPTSLRSLVIMCGDPWHWTNWGGLLESVKQGGPYFPMHFGDHFFSYIKKAS